MAEIAREATARSDSLAALSAWREAIELLPADSRQHAVVAATIEKLSKIVNNGSTPSAKTSPAGTSPGRKAAAGLGALGLLLWKLKFIVLLILTKGKLLLMGFTQMSTLLSMLLSLGVYWSVWGWKFALGLVLSIYIHEMGHVLALRRFGFKASAPLFLPGLGAVIRMKQHPANAHEDAAIGLAGPIYGLGAAVASAGLWVVTKQPIFGAIATVGAWINLFNLLPVWTLDGGRAFRALSRNQRWIVAAAAGLSWYMIRDGIVPLLVIVIIGRTLTDREPGPGDQQATVQFVLLLLLLSLVYLLQPIIAHSI